MLGVLSTSGYFFIPSPDARNLVYDVVNNVVGVSAVVAILVGVRMYRPTRALPWYLFAAGLLLFVAGDFISRHTRSYCEHGFLLRPWRTLST